MEGFQDRTLVLATMHKKEQAIAPLIESHLGVRVIVPANFNTDLFGTFTREIKRSGTQLEAARLKAQKALETTGETLAIASEGSFFPHPAFPYVCCDCEIVFLLDLINNLEIIGEEISTKTNFSHQTIKTIEEGLEFAEKVDFPNHGLIVMFGKNQKNKDKIFKGITNETQLIDLLEYVLKHSPTKTAHLETDMRAMYNPTRLRVISQATQNLIKKIKQFCPQCSVPGFDIIERQAGLPCRLCRTPTSLIKIEIWGCQKCHFQQVNNFPDNSKFAEPIYCQYCNP